MNEQLQQAVIAASAIKKLRELHQKFAAGLALPAAECPDIGAITVTADLIECACLDQRISASPRPIVRNKQISALEYNFIAQWKSEEVSVMRLYLQPGGTLTRDPIGNDRFCDFNNTYIHRNILTALSEALLDSPLYAPSEG